MLTLTNCDIYSLGYLFVQTIQNEAIRNMDGMCNLRESLGNRYSWMALRERTDDLTGLEQNSVSECSVGRKTLNHSFISHSVSV